MATSIASTAIGADDSRMSNQETALSAGELLTHTSKPNPGVVAPRIRSLKGVALGVLNIAALVGMLILTSRLILFSTGASSITRHATFTVGTSEADALLQGRVLMMLLRTASDIPEQGVLSESGGRAFPLDTGLGHVICLQTPTELVLVLGQACVGASDSGEGVLSSKCRLIEAGIGTMACAESCLHPNGSDATFDLVEYYRTKNSLGFGATYAEQHVSLVEQTSADTFDIHVAQHVEHKSNALTLYGIPLQDVVTMILFLQIIFNLFARLLTCSIFFTGIDLNGALIRVKADLGGGAFTSPGISFVTFLFFGITGPHLILFVDASKYSPSLFSECATTAMVSSVVAFSCRLVLRRTRFRFTTTGSLLFAACLLARFLTFDLTQNNAQTTIRGLGQVLEQECLLTDSSGTKALFQFNVADGCGLSGLEIFYKVHFETYFVALFLLGGLELCFWCKRAICPNFRQKGTIHPSSSQGNAPRRRRMGGTSVGTTIPNVPDYDKVTLLSGQGQSVFCKEWAAPIRTVMGRFSHASTMIEDNVVMFGPLLISLNLFPLASASSFVFGRDVVIHFIIKYKLYIGVSRARFRLSSLRENGSAISDFVATYDFENMSHFINGLPVE